MTIDEIEGFLDNEFQRFEKGREKFPTLFRTGVADAAVHAAGVSYLLSLGLECGLPTIAEYPISIHAKSPWKEAGRIFPDSLWFTKDRGYPWIAFEFERFERNDENKIREKAENLVLSYHQSGGSVRLCVFIYWLRSSLSPKTVAPLFKTFSNGFYRKGISVPPPDCKLLVYKVVMCQAGDKTENQHLFIREAGERYDINTEGQDILILREIRKIDRFSK